MTRRPRKTAFGAQLSAALVCKKTSKRMFADEASAMKVVEASHRSPNWKNVHGQPARRAYKCEHCGWWHLTHKPEGRKP